VLLLLVSAAQAQPGPGPGEPFGGDDSGCVPTTSDRLTCSSYVSKAFGRLERAVVLCHVRQANTRYRQTILGNTGQFDEETCEAKASAVFDKTFARLSARSCKGSPLINTVAGDRDALIAALDTQDGGPYCDATTATPIDPGGDDAGFVPAAAPARRCAEKVSRQLVTLANALRACHRTAGSKGFHLADPAYDEDGCEAKARAAFDGASARLQNSGDCPACLDASGRANLADAVAARIDSTNLATFSCPDKVLHPGAVQLDRPTLIALGVQWFVAGDENFNATVTVRYRQVGAMTWNNALPLMRVHPETVKDRVIAPQFAGSIFDLRPSTTYEIELHATDADGSIDETQTVTATTRAVPGDPVAPNVVAVTNSTELQAALDSAQPGDVISLADGVYNGQFVLEASGTAENPIVIRGASRDGTILDGEACACNVFEAYGSFVHVEQLTLRNANRALRFQTAGAQGNVVRRVHSYATTLGFAAREDQLDFYICDNQLEGVLSWPHIYTDDDGLYSNYDGILVQGQGHVVCHNQIIGFGDAMKTEEVGDRALDFYGNEVLSAYDNGIELDLSDGNVRCWRNRFTNNFMPISFQPIYGGPAYALRNIGVNNADEPLKFHGLGSGTGPTGVLVYHNTFVSPSSALQLSTSAASHYFEIANNLFVGPATPVDRVVDWDGPIDHGLFDFNGYFPDGAFRFNVKGVGPIDFDSFAALQAGGWEAHGKLLAQPIFANGLVPPPDYTTTLAPQDVTLDAGSVAVDAGEVLPNVNDDFQGSAPDLGAYERGCALPIYGIRPPGTDESNQPLGCNP